MRSEDLKGEIRPSLLGSCYNFVNKHAIVTLYGSRYADSRFDRCYHRHRENEVRELTLTAMFEEARENLFDAAQLILEC